MKRFFIILFSIMAIATIINNIICITKGYREIGPIVWGFVLSALFVITVIAIINGEKIIDFIDDIIDKIIDKR